MNINHSAEYLALWKSHKRAEWEAVRLDEEAKGMSRKAGTVGVMVQDSNEAGSGDEISEQFEDGITAELLLEESRRMWNLYEEIKAELVQVEATLTVDQRKNAEKVLKQWEREELARG